MTDVALPQPEAAYAPSRLDEAKRLASLTWTLALTDWKLRFYGSVLGFAWTLVRPFALFGVIYVVFTEIAGLDENVRNYGIYILFAMVLFNYFAETTTTCVQALVNRENLLRKIQFNPMVIPLSVSVTALLNLGTTLSAVFLFAVGSGVYPTWSWLELIPIVVLLAMFATGIGMLLSVLFVRFRDVFPIWEVILQILFYGSAVLYVAVDTVPDSFRGAFLCNPLSALFTQMRHAVVDPQAPAITSAFSETEYVLIPLTVILVAFTLGVWFFLRESPRVAENL